VHVEATDRLGEIIEIFGGRALMLGVALKLETPIEDIAPFMAGIKNVHLMSIAEIGHHGEPFDKAVLEKIKTLRQKYPSVIIGVDGGVNLDNAKSIIDAGANELIVGSALWRSKDIAKTITEFKKLITDH
jgi:ribulose-phosphate 3-epimerase